MKEEEELQIIFDGNVFDFWEAVYLFYATKIEDWGKFVYFKDDVLSTITTNPYIKGEISLTN